MIKRCGGCKVEMDVALFYKRVASADGLQSSCKTCVKAYGAENVEQIRTTRLKRTYNLTPDQWEEMYEEQGGVCAICELEETVKCASGSGKIATLVVDHDHDTGFTRALLCNRCNTATGQLRDNAATAHAVGEYITKWWRINEERDIEREKKACNVVSMCGTIGLHQNGEQIELNLN